MSKMSDFQILLFEETYKARLSYEQADRKLGAETNLGTTKMQELYIERLKAKGVWDACVQEIDNLDLGSEYLDYVDDLLDDETTESYTFKSVTANDNNDSRFNTFNSDSLK